MSPILWSIKFETKWFRIRIPIYLDISHLDHMDTWFRLTNQKRFILTSIRRKRIETGTVVTMIYLIWSLIMWSHATRQIRNSLSSPPQELPPKNLIRWLLVVTKSHQISLLILFSCGQVRSHVKCYIFSSFETYEHQNFKGQDLGQGAPCYQVILPLDHKIVCQMINSDIYLFFILQDSRNTKLGSDETYSLT